MLEFFYYLTTLIYTSATFIYEFIFLNVLSPENVQMLLDELRHLYGALGQFSKRIIITDYWQKYFLIVALNFVKQSLIILANFLEGSEDWNLRLAHNITLMTIELIDKLITQLGG
uniref:Uncharacterized protein n=1 Tax=Ophiognomonia clavigignenti-juglandacearum TaxID=218668 RepID=A0A2C9DSD3_9PEZI|nr:hypothetical protein [Ophiognomonia clavigignenti-juglandacearum]